MLLRKPNFNKIMAVMGLSTTLNVCWASFPNLVQAEETQVARQHNRENVNKTDKKNTKTRGGLPIHRIGGGSRGNCIANRGQLVALVPEDVVGITASNNPKLFFYIPKTTKTHLIEFVVRNQQDELVYDAVLETSDRAGIITVELPPSLHQEFLKTNENYHWYLSMICNQQKRSHDIVVEGWLRRIEVDPAISQKLQDAHPLEQASLYQQQGIWHDALSLVAQQKNTANYRSAAKAKWAELLNALGLAELANQPLIETNQFSSTEWLSDYSSR